MTARNGARPSKQSNPGARSRGEREASGGSPTAVSAFAHRLGLVGAAVVVLEPVGGAEFGCRPLHDAAVGDDHEAVALADLARVAEAGLQLGLDQLAAPVVPHDLRPALHEQP